MSEDKARQTEGMPDMMPQGTVDNPPQKEPQEVPLRMQDQPYGETQPTDPNMYPEMPADPDKKNPDNMMPNIGDPKTGTPKM